MAKPRRALMSRAIGQTPQRKSQTHRILLKPPLTNLDELVAQITPKNCHTLLLDDAAQGCEAW